MNQEQNPIAQDWVALVEEAKENPLGSIEWVDASTVLYADKLITEQELFKIELLKDQFRVTCNVIDSFTKYRIPIPDNLHQYKAALLMSITTMEAVFKQHQQGQTRTVN